MKPGHGFRQSEAHAGARRAARGFQPHKPLLHPLKISRSYPHATIPHGDRHLMVEAGACDTDMNRRPVASGAIIQGIDDQIADRLPQQFPAAAHLQSGHAVQIQRPARLLHHRLIEFDASLHGLADITRHQSLASGTSFHPRDLQQRIKHRQKPVGFNNHLLQRRLMVLLGIKLRQGLLGAVAQPGQRRFQIMGDIVGYFPHLGHQLVDAIQHGIEILRQPVKLVLAPGLRQALIEIARHDFRRRGAHRINAAQDAARQQQATDQAQRSQRPQRHQETAGKNGAQRLAISHVAPHQQMKAARQ